MPTASACHPSPRSIRVLLISACGLISIWAILIFGPKPWSISPSESIMTSPAPATPSPSKYAFATILTGEGDVESSLEDPYFMAARLLTYQLLHSPDTRSADDIPLLVLVTENIPQEQRTVLAQDGATVVPVESITRGWVHPKWERWGGVLAKLNTWNMTEYDKIAFVDADSMLFKPIDGIFTDPSTAIQQTNPSHSSKGNEEGKKEEELPSTYLIAGIHDSWVEHNLPPTPGEGTDFYVKDNYMNAGFLILAPSEKMFEYYLRLLDQPSAFDPNYPEQNLLNCAHRVDGRMPWKDIGRKWNKKGAGLSDYEDGLKSVHQKWWVAMGNEVLDGYVANITAEMKTFFANRD